MQVHDFYFEIKDMKSKMFIIYFINFDVCYQFSSIDVKCQEASNCRKGDEQPP